MIKIYTLSDPNTNKIRYVGQTEKPLLVRLKSHINGNDSTHVRCWIKNLKKNKLIPTIELVDEVSNDEWIFWEQFYISLFKTWGFDLTNHTIGGDGCRIGHHTDETKNKISISRKIQGSPWMNNRNVSEETKIKTSNTLKGRKLPIERALKAGKSHEKKVVQFDLEGNYIKTFNSAFEGSIEINRHMNCIQACVTGKCRSAGGFIWRYENDDFNKFPTKINQTKMKPVLQYDLEGNFIKEWISASQPQKELKYISVSIIRCCNNKQNFAYGFKWKYKEKSV